MIGVIRVQNVSMGNNSSFWVNIPAKKEATMIIVITNNRWKCVCMCKIENAFTGGKGCLGSKAPSIKSLIKFVVSVTARIISRNIISEIISFMIS